MLQSKLKRTVLQLRRQRNKDLKKRGLPLKKQRKSVLLLKKLSKSALQLRRQKKKE